MDIQIKVLGTCSSGGHIHLQVLSPKGNKELTLSKEDLRTDQDNWEDAIIILLRSFIKESGLTNWGQIKTAVEAKTFKL
jgi:hypothetical protein